MNGNGYRFERVDEQGMYSDPAFLHVMGVAEPFPPGAYLNPRSGIVHHQNPNKGRFSLCSRNIMDDYDRIYVYSSRQVFAICADRLALS